MSKILHLVSAVVFISTLGFVHGSFADDGVTIEGTLLEKGTKVPVPEANIFILPAKLKGTTDQSGNFRIENVPAGDFQFVVNLTGYERLDFSDFQAEGAASPGRTLYLSRASYQVYETTVYGKEDKRDDSTRSLRAMVASKLPGSNGDPVKGIQNLPGVSRTAGLGSQVIIQGSAPGDTRYMIDGHDVPIIFHFGGFSSVVLPEALDRVDYLSAGYGAEYGRALGGLVGVVTRKPSRERVKGFAYADLINAGAAIETPVGETGSLFIGLRRSYIGNLLKAAIKEKDDDSVNLTAAPAFQDFTLVYERPLSNRDQFRFALIGSQDSLDFILKKPPENDPKLRGDFETKTSFVRAIPQWTHRHSDRTISRLSLGLGRDWLKFVLDDQYFRLSLYSVTARYDLERKWSSSWTSYLGLDSQFQWAKLALNLPTFYSSGGVSNPLSSGQQNRIGVRTSSENLGLYWNNDVKLTETWTLKPGARIDTFSNVDGVMVSPRFAIRKALTPFQSIRLASGLYFQPPTGQQTSEDVGNPDLRAPRAIHLAATYERDFREGSSNGWTFSGGPFVKRFDRLVNPSTAVVDKNGSSVPEYYNNLGKGRALGLEALLRLDANPWNGWLSYTASRSTRKEPGQSSYPAAYDQTHNINLIIGRDLPRNWRIAGRFRFVTGNPLTPVNGSVFDSDNDSYIPVRGPYYSTRVNSFYQLDIRVDKKWIYDRMIVTAYLDIQNVTNRKNVESVSYAYDYSKRSDVTGLPVIPSIGLKGEF